ncbi:MAG TPA: hypothetical protein VFH46_05765 [Pyrinomonadaceae bacterium]|nr:hypothetical protein [Pyrinomonadaceae bacterium]
MLYPQLEQRLQASKRAVNRATSESVVEQCRQYLTLLAEYRSRLYELQGTLGESQKPGSPSPTEEVPDRKTIREAIERTTRERNITQLLLLSFTTVSGYEAVEIFNQRKYEGHDDWELRASGVKFRGGGDSDLMTVQEAVDLAGMFRREDHVAQNPGEVETT